MGTLHSHVHVFYLQLRTGYKVEDWGSHFGKCQYAITCRVKFFTDDYLNLLCLLDIIINMWQKCPMLQKGSCCNSGLIIGLFPKTRAFLLQIQYYKISNTTSVYTTFSYKTNILFLFFVACDLKHFKVDVGNEPCKPCGAKSTSVGTSCKCSEDHHRAVGQNYNSSSPCYSKYLILSLLGKIGDMRLIESWTIEQWNFVAQNYEISY